MDDWCDFRIDRWTKVDELTAKGAGLKVTWPDAPPPPTDPDELAPPWTPEVAPEVALVVAREPRHEFAGAV